jgi:hypothetical protein
MPIKNQTSHKASCTSKGDRVKGDRRQDKGLVGEVIAVYPSATG